MRQVFTVYGSPVAQGRPRFVKRGAFQKPYDPATSKDWKRRVESQILDALKGTPSPTRGPVSLHLFFHLPRPKSLPKRVIHHIKKPDVDNLAKAVKDAVKGILFHDDSQVVSMMVSKSYGDPPRVVIGMEDWTG